MGDGTIWLTDGGGRVKKLVEHLSQVTKLEFDAYRLYSSSLDGKLLVWMTTDSQIMPITLFQSNSWLHCFTFSKEMDYIWTGEQGRHRDRIPDFVAEDHPAASPECEAQFHPRRVELLRGQGNTVQKTENWRLRTMGATTTDTGKKNVLRLLLCAALIAFPTSISELCAQGLPLIRNYAAAEYGGHNRCYDLAAVDNGTVFVANFEGLLYYDRSRWRIIYSPGMSRVTVVYRDGKNIVWVGGYNFIARLRKRDNGELYMEQLGKNGQFKGEVMEIFEDEGSLQFVASDNNIYEIKDNKILLKEHTNAKFSPGIDSDIVSLKALKEGDEKAILNDITQTEIIDLPNHGKLQVIVKKNMGLIIADEQGTELYKITEANGLCSNQVAYVNYDGHGILWGVTSHGIFALEIPSIYSYFLPKDGLTGEVNAITAFDDKIYVGGTNGLFCIASRQCRRIPDINNTPTVMSNLVLGWQATPRLKLHTHVLFESKQTSYNTNIEKLVTTIAGALLAMDYANMGMLQEYEKAWQQALDDASELVMHKEMPARAILNIGGEYAFGPITIGLNVHNVLGTRYHRSGMNTNIIPQQGRWFLGSLAIQL